MSNYTREQIEKMKQDEAARREQQRLDALRRNEHVRRLWADEGRHAAMLRSINQQVPPLTVKL